MKTHKCCYKTSLTYLHSLAFINNTVDLICMEFTINVCKVDNHLNVCVICIRKMCAL